MLIRRLLVTAIVSALATAAHADDAGDDAERKHEKQLDQVTITAAPLQQRAEDVVHPVSVLAGAELEERRSATIGATVAQEPGVQSSSFGPGVGRPIIRGLEGARVQVLAGGVGAMDVSTVSVDHAVAIEPFLADQVEVLKGPSTLLYGSGAIGGVVNVVDGRIPQTPVEGVEGRAEALFDTVNQGRTGMGRLDAGNGRIAVHADYVRRYGDDFDLPHDATLLNSALDSRSLGVGVAYTGERGFAGVSVGTFDNTYGIPVGSSKDPNLEVDEVVRLAMDQTRIDAKAGWNSPFAGIERVNFALGRNDYEHVELTPDGVGTRFTNDAYEGRIELEHVAIADWRGAFGLQFGNRDFAAIGEEAFVPASTTDDLGVFWIEQREFAPFKLELGARVDHQKISLDDSDIDASHHTLSLSSGAVWDINEAWHVSLNLDRAQRAPTVEELFSEGPHEATGSFEVGDPTLSEETSNQLELGAHYHSDRVQAKASVYHNRFNDFMYLAETGQNDPEGGLPIRAWTQDDARFTGFEFEAKIKLADVASGLWQMRVFGDTVRGRLDEGGDLPRIAPARLGASLNWTYDAWRASLGAVRYDRQDRVAAFESPTPGYTLIDAHVSYAFSVGATEWEAFVDGSNLGNQDALVHTSLLRDRAPLPGRGIALGLRAYF